MSVNVHIEYLRNYKKDEWGPVSYSKKGDACVDLRAAITNSALLFKNSTAIIPTGIKLAIPEGYEMQIRPRSGFSSSTGVVIANSPGTIDSGYRGEIKVVLLTVINNGVQIKPGQRIAQLKLAKVPTINFIESRDITVFASERGEGGFGSTDEV